MHPHVWVEFEVALPSLQLRGVLLAEGSHAMGESFRSETTTHAGPAELPHRGSSARTDSIAGLHD